MNLFVNLQEYQHLIKLLCEVLDGDVDPLCNMQPKLQTQKTKPNNFPRQVCIFRQNLGEKKKSQFFCKQNCLFTISGFCWKFTSMVWRKVS